MLYNIKCNYNHCNNEGENVLMLTYSDARYIHPNLPDTLSCWTFGSYKCMGAKKFILNRYIVQ
jgi:hypothetical protein